MTLSPDLRVLTNGVLFWYCSAIKGLTLLLMPPVPAPIMIMAAMRPPREAPCSIATGRAVTNSTRHPTM